MVAPLFKDFAKKAEDVLDDDYDYTRKLKIKTRAANGVTFTTEGQLKANKSIHATVAGAFAHETTGVVFKKLQVSTQGRLVAEAELPNVLARGLKLTFELEDGSVKKSAGAAKQVGVVGAQFKQDKFSCSTTADFVGNNVKASGVFAQGNLLVGGQVGFNIDKTAITERSVGVSYRASDFATALVTKKNFGALAASFHHRVSKDTIYAAVLDYDLKTAANKLTVGGRYRVDVDSTYAGKIDSEGFVSLTSIQKVRPFVALTTSVQFDAKNFESDAHKFGIGLTLG